MVDIHTIEQLQAYIGVDMRSYDNEVEHPGLRLATACRAIAADIRLGSEAAAAIGVAIMLRDPRLPFGKLIKSAIARALKKRADLFTEPERQRFLYKTADLLSMEFCPREVEDYCALAKKLGPAACRVVVERAQPAAGKSTRLLAQLRELAGPA